ncbi:putative tetratricopeptide-like helical domain superfamily [Helianthus debilis subsp. tardiflorus]
MLGKHCLFDAMWDAIKSMKQEGMLSLATFASVFGSYVMADKVKDVLEAFRVMEQYGCVADVVALTSLFSAICRDGKTADARDFLNTVRSRIRPDADMYAILLEVWEKEQHTVNARETFDDIVFQTGWDPNNFSAYDSFLNVLLNGSGGLKEAMKFSVILKGKKCYPGIRFFKAALKECVMIGDVKAGKLLWDYMSVQNSCKPDVELYYSIIYLYTFGQDADRARITFDEMVFKGVFRDCESYNILFQFLIKIRNFREAQQIFTEMVKNEFVPMHAVVEAGNVLVGGLRDLNRVPEAVKYADDMFDRGIKLASVTLARDLALFRFWYYTCYLFDFCDAPAPQRARACLLVHN